MISALMAIGSVLPSFMDIYVYPAAPNTTLVRAGRLSISCSISCIPSILERRRSGSVALCEKLGDGSAEVTSFKGLCANRCRRELVSKEGQLLC